jgi:hypothetical protein
MDLTLPKSLACGGYTLKSSGVYPRHRHFDGHAITFAERLYLFKPQFRVRVA